MANETQTGMDRTEMKRFLIKSKQEQVNCALGVGDDKSVALLLLSPHRSPKALQGDLQKQFPSAFNTRFGTAVVDTEDDPTLVKFMLNKAVTSIARRLVKTLKGTGFRKVQILLEDGTPVEVAAEEEASDATIEATPEPDATALTTALTELAQRIADVADPARKEALAKQAREANVNIKVGNLTYAAGGIDSLRRALDAAVTTSTSTLRAEERPPPPPLPEPQAETDVVALTAALVELVQRIAVVADPAQKEALAKQAREANVNIKTGNLIYAATGIESLRRALDALVTSARSDSNQSAPPSLPEPEAKPDTAALVAALSELARRIATVIDPARKEALTKRAREVQVNIKTGNLNYAAGGIESLRHALDAAAAGSGNQPSGRLEQVLAEFDAAQATVNEQIAELQRELRDSADPDLQRIGQFGLNALTGNTRVKLQAAIMELRGGLPTVDPAMARNVARLAEQMAAFLSEDTKVRACDNNPFEVSMSINATLGGAARQLHEVLRQAA